MLVLCSSNDIPCLWAYQGLRKRGLNQTELISAEALEYSLRWVHQLDSSGSNVDILLADGRSIQNDSIDGVLNRLSTIPVQHLLMARAEDREYALSEMAAFYTSWLYALPRPILNLPTPQGPAGQWRHTSEWAFMASKAGLVTPEYKQSGYDYTTMVYFNGGMAGASLFPPGTATRTIIVACGHAIGPQAPSDIIEGCLSLAEVSGTGLLGIEFAQGPESHWTFAGATPMPDLRLGGEELLDALFYIFKRGDDN